MIKFLSHLGRLKNQHLTRPASR